MGAFSPSLLFDILLERFFDVVGVVDESAADGIGFDMVFANVEVKIEFGNICILCLLLC